MEIPMKPLTHKTVPLLVKFLIFLISRKECNCHTYSSSDSNIGTPEYCSREMSRLEDQFDALKQTANRLQSLCAASDQVSASRCPSEYSLAADGQCYRIVSDKNTWMEAQLGCASEISADGITPHLASIFDLENEEAIADVIQPFVEINAWKCLCATGLDCFHIGGLRKRFGSCHSEFIWASHPSEAMTYTNWFMNEPSCTPVSDSRYLRENCMAYYYVYGHPGWYDVSCDTVKLCSICQRAPLQDY